MTHSIYLTIPWRESTREKEAALKALTVQQVICDGLGTDKKPHIMDQVYTISEFVVGSEAYASWQREREERWRAEADAAKLGTDLGPHEVHTFGEVEKFRTFRAAFAEYQRARHYANGHRWLINATTGKVVAGMGCVDD